LTCTIERARRVGSYGQSSHQQYLSDTKNPYGYCNHGPNGLTCPIGVAKTDD
jgi:peptide-methionine (S)-S-oxide reductase